MTRRKLYRPGGVAAPRPRRSEAGCRGLCALLLALGAPAAAASCAATTVSEPEARCQTLSYGGRARSYRLYAPLRLAPHAPLLLVLHGGGGAGAGMETLTNRGFNRRADESGALIVYPEGVGRRWNDGRDGAGGADRDSDDVGYLRALVAALAKQYPLDAERVFAVGISNGGMMSLRLACEAADLFRGFVAVAASLGETLAGHCRPSAPRPLALIDGTADPLVPWAGGEVKAMGLGRGRVIGAEASFAAFRALAGCGSVQSEPPLDRIADDGTAVLIQRARGCQDAARIVLYQVVGGGHAWPGGLAYAAERLTGKVSRELDATEETWQFLGLRGSRRGPV